MKPRAVRPPPPALIGLLLVIGALGILGGLGLALSNGRWLGLPLDLLEHSPFASYRLPGLVLAVVVGGSQLAAGVAVWQRRPRYLTLAALAAVLLAGWIAIQALMIGIYWLQPVMFIAAIMELGLVSANLPSSTPSPARKRR